MTTMGKKKHFKMGQITTKSKHADTIVQSTFSFYISENGSGKRECLTGQNSSCDSVSTSEIKEDVNDNVHEEFFKKICNKTLLTPLIGKLDRCGLMKDFINLMEVLSNGTLDVENIPLLLCL